MEDTSSEMTDHTRLIGHASNTAVGCDNSQDHGQDNHGYHSLDVPTDTGPHGESYSSKSHNHRWVIGCQVNFHCIFLCVCDRLHFYRKVD